MRENAKLVKITGNNAIYCTEAGKIITESITGEALAVLRWYWKNIPAND